MGNCNGTQNGQDTIKDIKCIPIKMEEIRGCLIEVQEMNDTLVTESNELNSSQSSYCVTLPDLIKDHAQHVYQSSLYNSSQKKSAEITKKQREQKGAEETNCNQRKDEEKEKNNFPTNNDSAKLINSSSQNSISYKLKDFGGVQPPEKILESSLLPKCTFRQATKNSQMPSELFQMIFEDSGEDFQKRYKEIKVFGKKVEYEEDINAEKQNNKLNAKTKNKREKDKGEESKCEIESDGNYEGSDEENFKSKEKLIDNLFTGRSQRFLKYETAYQESEEGKSTKVNDSLREVQRDTSNKITIFPSLFIQNGGRMLQGQGELESNHRNRNGLGQQTYQDGTVYLGQWVQDKRNGKGIQIWPDNTLYEGQWNEDEIEGLGKIEYSNRSYYIGEWKANKFHGKGRFQHFSGAYYEGYWHFDSQDGRGVEVQLFPHYSKYEGIFQKGKKNGKGRLMMDNGMEYKGDFVNNIVHGLGVYKWPSGVVFEGRWENSKMNGSGKMIWPNNICYQGEFRNDQKSGVGTIEYSDGSKYIGDWKNDKQHGKGTFYFKKNQAQLKGEWTEGKLTTIISIQAPKINSSNAVNMNQNGIQANMLKSVNSQRYMNESATPDIFNKGMLNSDKKGSANLLSIKISQQNKNEDKKVDEQNFKKNSRNFKKTLSIQSDI